MSLGILIEDETELPELGTGRARHAPVLVEPLQNPPLSRQDFYRSRRSNSRSRQDGRGSAALLLHQRSTGDLVVAARQTQGA